MPAHRWQFISWPRVMNTWVPGVAWERERGLLGMLIILQPMAFCFGFTRNASSSLILWPKTALERSAKLTRVESRGHKNKFCKDEILQYFINPLWRKQLLLCFFMLLPDMYTRMWAIFLADPSRKLCQTRYGVSFYDVQITPKTSGFKTRLWLSHKDTRRLATKHSSVVWAACCRWLKRLLFESLSRSRVVSILWEVFFEGLSEFGSLNNWQSRHRESSPQHDASTPTVFHLISLELIDIDSVAGFFPSPQNTKVSYFSPLFCLLTII